MKSRHFDTGRAREFQIRSHTDQPDDTRQRFSTSCRGVNSVD